MAFTLLSTTFVERATKTVIQSGSTAGFRFQIRTLDLNESDVIQWGWAYNFWATGNADIGNAVIQQIRLNQRCHDFSTLAVPEGTQGIAVYLPEKSPLDGTNILLYRRL